METKPKQKLRNRRFKLGRLTVSLSTLLIVAALVSIMTVSATAYVLLQWTISATVVANPKACFIQWSGASKANTFSYSVNIFPSLTTIDNNITYGIWNWNNAGAVSMCWYSLTSSANIASLGIKVYNTTSIIYQQYWTSVPSFPTSYVTFSPAMMGNGKYTMAMNITATSGASGSSTFTFNLQVMNP